MLHHLFLVDDDAVGLFENILRLRDIVDDFFAAMFAIDEVVDHVHRPGPVEGVQRDQVFERSG